MKNKSRLKRHRQSHKNKRKHHTKKQTPQQAIVGKIAITSGGLGFVSPNARTAEKVAGDIFIPPQFVRSAMDGDIVEVSLLPERRGFNRLPQHGPAGKVSRIIKRNKTIIVGELLAGKKVRPIDRHIPEDISVAGKLNGAKRGEWVEVELLHRKTPRANTTKRGVVRGRLGEAGVIANDLDAICKEFKLSPPYNDELNKFASDLKPQRIERQDLRSVFTLTIDPKDAKDFDDAISVADAEDERELKLFVHIADVAAFIIPDSPLDKEAYIRGFTSYLPGRTLPMLPKSLTAAISLNEKEDSLAHTVEMTINKRSGRITSFKRYHSTINVNKRLSFCEVQQFIDKQATFSADLVDELQRIIKLFKAMRRYRKRKEKFLEMSIPETRILVNEQNNEIIGLARKEQAEADQLVEEFMLAANSEVAKSMIERGIPGIFRVHPQPDPEKIAEFSALAAESFGITPGDLTSRVACNDFLENLPDGPRKPAILSAFLRSLPRALYQEDVALHFGLGKGRYLHFTSPIRRYTDLFVHQQLWLADTNKAFSSKKVAGNIAKSCASKEENNDNAYFTANDRLKLRYLEQELGNGQENLHEAIIAKITSAGLVVDIQDIGIYGFVPLDQLPGDFRRKGNRLIDKFGKKNYKGGDYIYLKLTTLDLVRGRAIFKPA